MFLPSLGCTWRTSSENFLQVRWLWLNQECLLSSHISKWLSKSNRVSVENPFSQDGNTMSLQDLWACGLVSSLAQGMVQDVAEPAASDFQSQLFRRGSLQSQGGTRVWLPSETLPNSTTGQKHTDGVSVICRVLGWCQPYTVEMFCDKGLNCWIWVVGLQITRKLEEKCTVFIKKKMKWPYV